MGATFSQIEKVNIRNSAAAAVTRVTQGGPMKLATSLLLVFVLLGLSQPARGSEVFQENLSVSASSGSCNATLNGPPPAPLVLTGAGSCLGAGFVSAGFNDIGAFAEAVNGPGVNGSTSVSAYYDEGVVFSSDQVPMGSMMDVVIGLGVQGSVTLTNGSGDYSLLDEVIVSGSSGNLSCGIDQINYGLSPGVVSELLFSPVCRVANGQELELSLIFGLGLSPENEGSAYGDLVGLFPDPSITNIEITDPNTGQPIPGVTVTGQSGTVYTVNASTVPEPATFPVIFAGILILLAGWFAQSKGVAGLAKALNPTGSRTANQKVHSL